jgi:hypothetical protein
LTSLPPGIKLELLPGPARGKPPALYARDEVVYSPSGQYFALAYTIAETRMGNEVGCLLWGQRQGDHSTTLGNPPGVHVTCWYSPWASWISDQTFVFKAQHWDGFRLHLPLVAVKIGHGTAVLSGTNNADSRPTDELQIPTEFFHLNPTELLRAISDA